MAGWIADHRKELESDIWLMPPMYHRIWQWIKYSVNHTDARIPNKDGSFTVINPGQRATSYRQIAKGVGYYEGKNWNEPNAKTVKSILDWLTKQKMISIQGNTLGTIVTVENWELYQSELIQGNSKRITVETRRKHGLDTNNNDKEELNNENNELKNSMPGDKPPDEPKVKKYNADADPTNKYHQAAVHFAEMVLKANPTCKVPKEGTESMGKWAREIRLMFESDKRDREHVRETLTYCFEKDAFWSHTCQSPANFRKNYDKISGKMLSNQKTGVNKPNSKFSQSIDTMNEWLIEQEAKTIG